MDSISNLLTQIKNAASHKKETVLFPYSAYIGNILALLEKEKFVASVATRGKKLNKQFEITLRYAEDGAPAITGVRRLSKPSRRLYRSAGELRPVRSGYGKLFLSTPKGVRTDVLARRERVGGEALFEIW